MRPDSTKGWRGRKQDRSHIVVTVAIVIALLGVIVGMEIVRWEVWKKVNPVGTFWQFIILEGK